MCTKISHWIKDHQLGIFFTLAYAISWAIWSPLIADGLGWIDTGLPRGWHFLGSFGPLLAAFIVTGVSLGKQGIRDLLRRMLYPRVGLKWIIFALFSAPVVFLIAVLVLSLIRGEWLGLGQFGHAPEIPGLGWLGGWFLYMLTFGFGEETGWRGFALPRLQSRHDARLSTLILGVLWLGWHLPLFTYQYEGIDLFGLIGYVIGLLSGALLLTWLFNSSAGSILVVALWHGTYDAAVAGAPPEVSAMVTAVVIVAAILIGRRFGPEDLSAVPRQRIGS